MIGKSSKIPFGTGSVHGFFSQDNVKVGGAVLKQQVPVFAAEIVDIYVFKLHVE